MNIIQFIQLLTFCLFLCVGHFCLTEKVLNKQAEQKRGNRGNAVNITVYFGSQCEENSHFMKTQLQPIWEALSKYDRVRVELVPFGRGQCVPRDGDYLCLCQHGSSECELNQLMSCTMKYISSPKEYMPLIFCIQGKLIVEEAEEECLLTNVTVLQRKRLIECAFGKEGRRLLKASLDKTKEVKPEIPFFPWVTLNGKGSLFAIRILLRMICQNLDPLPDVCDGDQGFSRK